MRSLKPNDYEMIKTLINHTQNELISILKTYLKKHYDNVIMTKEYIIAIGDIPIGLVAHLDTVFDKHNSENKDLFYDVRQGVLFCPQGAGFDDKAGVFAILQIIKSGLRPSIIFTTGEEIGGVGATALAKKPCPIPNLKYLIELDRHGTNDCVFYDCYNPTFTKYVESFGFVERYGSFSDISILCPEWKICGVNLSIGYEDEHTYVETLWINAMFSTIAKVCKMLRVEDIPTFEYAELPKVYNIDKTGYYSDFWYNAPVEDEFVEEVRNCCKCHKTFLDYELFPVKNNTNGVSFYCSDCIVNNVKWCVCCKEPYETSASQDGLCKDCEEMSNG